MTSDTQAIRERAERLIELAGKATPGPWAREIVLGGHTQQQALKTFSGYTVVIGGTDDDGETDHNFNHIAANDPPTVTALARDLLAALDREKVLTDDKKYWHSLADERSGEIVRLMHRVEEAEAQLATLQTLVRKCIKDERSKYSEEPARWADCGCAGPLTEELADAVSAAFPASAPKGK